MSTTLKIAAATPCHEYAKQLDIEIDITDNNEWHCEREPIEAMLAAGIAIGPITNAIPTQIKNKKGEVYRLQWELEIAFDQHNRTKLPLNSSINFVSPTITESGDGTRFIEARGTLKSLSVDKIIVTTDPNEQIKPGAYLTENTQEYSLRIKRALTKSSSHYPLFASPPSEAPWCIRGVDQVTTIQEALAATDFFAIQGPPGTGKTYVLAKIAIELIKQGKRVYVMAFSNQAVENALLEIREVSQNQVKVLKKGDRREIDADPKIEEAETDDLITNGAVCIGSTFHSMVTVDGIIKADVILIDEAGQVPIYCAALLPHYGKKFIYFGDHKQLSPVSPLPQPESLPTSALTHIIAQMHARHIPNAVGLIETHRLPEKICQAVREHFYSDGVGALNLQSSARNKDSAVSGTHLEGRLVVLEHNEQGSGQFNEQEVLIIQNIVMELLTIGRVQIDQKEERPVKPNDIVVLAPFRWQTQLLKKTLPSGITVGTVDKMQGQSVPITIYSLTAGHPIDIAAMAEFIFDPHRINVAISRSKAQCIIVGNLEAHLNAKPKTAKGLKYHHHICGLLQKIRNGNYLAHQ